ncbi:MAG TPA: LysE/ArgO family amino acid transporter [Nocardioides sp.]|nr:LysE/ArgO family amino acid transporter [Nocardioides sp.]
MITSALAGLATGLSLIVAIGAQNAFVLRQGLARRHVGAVVAVCAVSDVVLIAAGVVGIGTVVERAPVVLDVLRWLGVAFLAAYGVRSLLAARASGGLEAAAHGSTTRLGAVATAAALTYLNPHVYLDTVLLLGSVANQQAGDGRWWFACGAATGSILWFSGLGYGARGARGLLATPRSWQVLDLGIGVVMLAFACMLALS